MKSRWKREGEEVGGGGERREEEGEWRGGGRHNREKVIDEGVERWRKEGRDGGGTCTLVCNIRN